LWINFAYNEFFSINEEYICEEACLLPLGFWELKRYFLILQADQRSSYTSVHFIQLFSLSVAPCGLVMCDKKILSRLVALGISAYESAFKIVRIIIIFGHRVLGLHRIGE
jgi:hypothetical protein